MAVQRNIQREGGNVQYPINNREKNRRIIFRPNRTSGVNFKTVSENVNLHLTNRAFTCNSAEILMYLCVSRLYC